ncbi:MAG: usg protein [Geminicoccaceae bacterium]
MKEIQLLLNDYRLTTAELLYHMPDHPGVLQSFIWQDYDLSPKYPRLTKFIAFWQREIEGPLHSVKVGTCEILAPSDFSHVDGVFNLH